MDCFHSLPSLKVYRESSKIYLFYENLSKDNRLGKEVKILKVTDEKEEIDGKHGC